MSAEELRKPIGEDRVFLSAAPASRSQNRLAWSAVLVSGVIFFAAAPFATQPLARRQAFIPAYESTLVISDLITAVLLFAQFDVLRSRALFVLASGYLFTAFIAVSHALTFPDCSRRPGCSAQAPKVRRGSICSGTPASHFS